MLLNESMKSPSASSISEILDVKHCPDINARNDYAIKQDELAYFWIAMT
jgi:hypothetical protein